MVVTSSALRWCDLQNNRSANRPLLYEGGSALFTPLSSSFASSYAGKPKTTGCQRYVFIRSAESLLTDVRTLSFYTLYSEFDGLSTTSAQEICGSERETSMSGPSRRFKSSGRVCFCCARGPRICCLGVLEDRVTGLEAGRVPEPKQGPSAPLQSGSAHCGVLGAGSSPHEVAAQIDGPRQADVSSTLRRRAHQQG